MPDRTNASAFSWAAIAFFASITANILWTLDKGLIFADEAFYLLHFRDDAHPVHPGSWQILFRPLFVESLVYLRLIMFSATGAAAFFLGYASSKSLHFRLPPWITGILAASAQFLLLAPVQFVPAYFTLNVVAMYPSTALFLFSTTVDGRLRAAALFASGLFMGALPFLMITNSAFALALLLAIWLTTDTPIRIWSLVSFLAGIALFVAVYFTCFQRVGEFVDKLAEARVYIGLDGFYGPQHLIRWHARLVREFVGRPLALALCMLLVATGALTNRFLRGLLAVLAGLLAAVQLYHDLTSVYAIFTVTLWYVLFVVFASLAAERGRGDRKQWVAISLLALIPYFASLGTYAAFELRAAYYFAGLFLAVLGVVHICGLARSQVLLALGLLTVCYLNFFTFNFREGWAKYKKVAQDQEVVISPRGGTIYLGAERKAVLDKVRPFIEGRRNVVVSDPSGWGYVYLSGASPLYLYFWFNEKALNHFLEQEHISVSSLLCLEDNARPFPESFRRRLVEKEGFKQRDLDGVIVYTREQPS